MYRFVSKLVSTSYCSAFISFFEYSVKLILPLLYTVIFLLGLIEVQPSLIFGSEISDSLMDSVYSQVMCSHSVLATAAITSLIPKAAVSVLSKRIVDRKIQTTITAAASFVIGLLIIVLLYFCL